MEQGQYLSNGLLAVSGYTIRSCRELVIQERY